MAACFLCKHTFNKNTTKKKRLLFGSSGVVYINTLDGWTEEWFSSKFSNAINEEMKASAYICWKCCNAVSDWNTYLKKAREIKDLMQTYMRQYYGESSNEVSKNPSTKSHADIIVCCNTKSISCSSATKEKEQIRNICMLMYCTIISGTDFTINIKLFR